MSQTLNLVSWNINGLRAVIRKNVLIPAINKLNADIYFFQEIKTQDPQLPPEILRDFDFCFHPASKPGYSGTLIMWRHYLSPQLKLIYNYHSQKDSNLNTNSLFDSNSNSNNSLPLNLENYPHLTEEGRLSFIELQFPTISSSYSSVLFLNVYFPNGGQGPIRLNYKMEFYRQFLNWTNYLRTNTHHHLIFGGDINTAHQPIDLARPQANINHTGFLPIERAWLDELIQADWIDSFRYLHPDTVQYSWWDYKTRARDRNVGWRIDYFFLTSQLLPTLKSALIHDQIMGSDHAPISLTLNFS